MKSRNVAKPRHSRGGFTNQTLGREVMLGHANPGTAYDYNRESFISHLLFLKDKTPHRTALQSLFIPSATFLRDFVLSSASVVRKNSSYLRHLLVKISNSVRKALNGCIPCLKDRRD